MDQPLVSFLCPTHGRCGRQKWVIDEAVYWFTRQSYPDCEMVVLNTAPNQIVWSGVDRVRVYNEPPYPTLGDKMNRLLELAKGEICVLNEDDDVSLPDRAAQAVRMLGDSYDYWSPMLWYYLEMGSMVPVPDGKGVGHTSSAFRREALLGKYPSLTRGHDAVIQNWALNHLRVNPQKMTHPKDITMYYRWGFDYHLSAQADMEAAYAGTPVGRNGSYVLEALARHDYLAMHRAVVAAYDSGVK